MSFGSTAVLSSGKDLSQVPVHIDHDFVLDFLYVDRHFDQNIEQNLVIDNNQEHSYVVVENHIDIVAAAAVVEMKHMMVVKKPVDHNCYGIVEVSVDIVVDLDQ